jgi:hypothetical protein
MDSAGSNNTIPVPLNAVARAFDDTGSTKKAI